MRNLFRTYRHSLYNYESVFPYAILGVVGGVASAFIILAFEAAIVLLGDLWGIGGLAEDFESLPRWAHFALPTAGGVLLGSVFALIKAEHRDVGIVHVLSRMNSHYGVLPWRNTLVQFLGGAFALATGQSGGREGPGVHLGAAANSLLGQSMRLPNNSLRVLIACGTAGGIAVSFNTPLAGVIFAMEVIVAEYTVIGFIPVILSAVSAMAISRAFDRGDPLFTLSGAELVSLWEVPFIVLLGLLCGAVVALFIVISKRAARLATLPVVVRFSLAGLVTGTLALAAPQVLGMGYDSLQDILLGQIAPIALIYLLLAKVLATGFTIGMGMPVGLIGPNMLIGACLGALLGTWGMEWMPGGQVDETLYVVIAMAAAMAAVLNAPLAAILAVVELTESINVIMPAMLAIVAANLCNTELFGQQAAHQGVLALRRERVSNDPLDQLLHRTHVTRIMETNVSKLDARVTPATAESLRQHCSHWCLVERENEGLFLLHGADLGQWLQEVDCPEEGLDLTDAPLRRWSITTVPVQASLRQAMDSMRSATAEVACVYGRGDGGRQRLLGVVSRDTAEAFTLGRMQE